MPTWNPRANDLFLKALELPAASERRALPGPGLWRGRCACGPRWKHLLEASDQAGSFLDRPAAEVGLTTPAPRPGDERPPPVGLERPAP